jgi:hypothetical protein
MLHSVSGRSSTLSPKEFPPAVPPSNATRFIKGFAEPKDARTKIKDAKEKEWDFMFGMMNMENSSHRVDSGTGD